MPCDDIELLTPGKVGESVVFSEMYDENYNPIADTKHPYMTFYVKADKEILPGDIIRAR